MIYLDPSSIFKILNNESESPAVVRAISQEREVIISQLAELEVLNNLKSDYLGGSTSLKEYREHETRLLLLKNQEPYSFARIPSDIFNAALRQYKNSLKIHCRTVDRLHLAAMEVLKINRLMTHDLKQGIAAKDLGFEVVSPGSKMF